MRHYEVKEETYDAYSYLIDIFKEKPNIVLEYGGATDIEDENLIAKEIYTHFGTHYYKCINSLNDMSNKEKYKELINEITRINILDIGCNVGTATYSYIDSFLENRNENEQSIINIIFIEMSQIRVTWLIEMFDKYIDKINIKYKNVTIKYNIINECFPVELAKIEEKLIDAPMLVLISNFTRWNGERELAESINELYKIDKKIYLLNIEIKAQLNEITAIVNYMKQYKIYHISGPTSKSKFKYSNLKCSYWKNKSEYEYNTPYYQTNIKEQDLFEYINNKDRILKVANKTINTLSNLIISDEIEVNYFIKNKSNVIDIARKLMKEDCHYIYSDNYMEYSVLKKDNTTRPLIIESSINELVSTSIITSIGLCIDNIQNGKISFGNRLEEKDEMPYVTKKFMEQYFNNFVLNQKQIKEKDEYKYYMKLDLKAYYKNINHEKLLNILENYLKENTWFKHEEWLKCIINNYITRELLGTENGKGIPQGLPLSGVLSNMYLNYYDNWFYENCKDDKMFRYVDDMIIFSNENPDNNEDKYTKVITNDLKLQLNDNKTDKNEVDRLEFCELGDSYESISKLSKYIYDSIYNLPPSVYNLYMNNNRDILNLLNKTFNSIGVNISASWLAKKIRKRKYYFSGSKINYGKMYGKKNLNIEEWKREFIRKNKKFMDNLNLLKDKVATEFELVYKEVKEGDNTLTQRKFKFLFNKLGTFINKELIDEELFDYVYSQPWLIDLKKLKGYTNLKHKVFSNINEDYSDYCNIILIWLIGEYEAVEYLDDIGDIYINTLKNYKKDLRLVNTIACETMLKLLKDNKTGFSKTEVIKKLLKDKLTKKLDYIFIRNALMLLNVLDFEWLKNEELGMHNNLELEEVLSWIKNNLGENIIEVLEPMYEKYGEYLPDEEPTGSVSSRY